MDDGQPPRGWERRRARRAAPFVFSAGATAPSDRSAGQHHAEKRDTGAGRAAWNGSAAGLGATFGHALASVAGAITRRGALSADVDVRLEPGVERVDALLGVAAVIDVVAVAEHGALRLRAFAFTLLLKGALTVDVAGRLAIDLAGGARLPGAGALAGGLAFG